MTQVEEKKKGQRHEAGTLCSPDAHGIMDLRGVVQSAIAHNLTGVYLNSSCASTPEKANAPAGRARVTQGNSW